MPDMRALLLAAGVGLGVALLTIVVWHVPIALGAGAGILLGGLALTGAVSVRVDSTAADVAWREAAPDLVGEPAGPTEGVLPGSAAAVSPEPGGSRARDLPSGD